MSTASLPSYRYEPRDTEHLLAAQRGPYGANGASDANFVKNSRTGGVVLRLSGQRAGATLPEYGRAGVVEGTIEIKPEIAEGALSVDVKIEGTLKLKEVAEGGTHTSSLCLDVKTLWTRDTGNGPCPTRFTFALQLPMTFHDERTTYPLPPTYEAHLSGVPGFRANIDYAVTATVARHKISLFGLANATVSTPFVYRPRSYPALPVPMSPNTEVMHPSTFQSKEWSLHQTVIKSKKAHGDDINIALYLPALHVYSMTEEIPFHLFLMSSATSLAAFLPYAPAASRASSTPSDRSDSPGSGSTKPGATRVQLLRQTAVDVRSIYKRSPPVRGNNTDIWKTVQIGEGAFRRAGGGGHDWVAWSGRVRADRSVCMAGFKASGLNVKDFFVLTMVPPDPGRSPFADVRLIIPVKLTTDSWTPDAIGPDVGVLSDAEGDVPSLFEHETPELRYDG